MFFVVILIINRPYFDHSKSQTTLNQTSLTKEEANALSRAVATAFRENNGSHDDNSDDPRSDLDTRYVSLFPSFVLVLLKTLKTWLYSFILFND